MQRLGLLRLSEASEGFKNNNSNSIGSVTCSSSDETASSPGYAGHQSWPFSLQPLGPDRYQESAMVKPACQLLDDLGLVWVTASTQVALEWGHFLLWVSHASKSGYRNSCLHLLDSAGFSLKWGLERMVMLLPQHPECLDCRSKYPLLDLFVCFCLFVRLSLYNPHLPSPCLSHCWASRCAAQYQAP